MLLRILVDGKPRDCTPKKPKYGDKHFLYRSFKLHWEHREKHGEVRTLKPKTQRELMRLLECVT